MNKIDPDGLSPLAFADPNLFYALDEETRMSDPGYRAGKAAAQVVGTGIIFAEKRSLVGAEMRRGGDWQPGRDKRLHCEANCEATQLGDVGESIAETLSDFRETYQQELSGAGLEDAAADQAANERGREFGAEFPLESCAAMCGSEYGTFPDIDKTDLEPEPIDQ